MLISHSELFPYPSNITIEINSRVIAGARECNIISTREEHFINEYGESESTDTTLSTYRHYIQLESIDICSAEDFSSLCGATVRISVARKAIIFKDCKTYKTKTKIVGDKECISEICLVSPHKLIREAAEIG